MSLFNNKLQKVQLGMLGQDVQDKFTGYDTSLAQKAQQTDVNNALSLKADKTITDNLQNQVSSLSSGAPKAVSLVSQMTDTTKNYVYTGAESGYTAGHWYYWNGSVWTDGGVYQATAIGSKTITTDKIADNTFQDISSAANVLNLSKDLFVPNYITGIQTGTMSSTEQRMVKSYVANDESCVYLKDYMPNCIRLTMNGSSGTICSYVSSIPYQNSNVITGMWLRKSDIQALGTYLFELAIIPRPSGSAIFHGGLTINNLLTKGYSITDSKGWKVSVKEDYNGWVYVVSEIPASVFPGGTTSFANYYFRVSNANVALSSNVDVLGLACIQGQSVISLDTIYYDTSDINNKQLTLKGVYKSVANKVDNNYSAISDNLSIADLNKNAFVQNYATSTTEITTVKSLVNNDETCVYPKAFVPNIFRYSVNNPASYIATIVPNIPYQGGNIIAGMWLRKSDLQALGTSTFTQALVIGGTQVWYSTIPVSNLLTNGYSFTKTSIGWKVSVKSEYNGWVFVVSEIPASAVPGGTITFNYYAFRIESFPANTVCNLDMIGLSVLQGVTDISFNKIYYPSDSPTNYQSNAISAIKYAGNLNAPTKTWENKDILFLGDSITAMGYWVSVFNGIVKPKSTINVAVGSSTIKDKIGTVLDGNPVSSGADNNVNNTLSNQVQKIVNNNYPAPSAIFIASGVNDDITTTDINYDIETQFTNGTTSYIPISSCDRKTFAGAMRYCVETLLTLYPNTQIFIIPPLQAAEDFKSYTNNIKPKHQIITNLANRLSIPIVDASNECGIYGGWEKYNTVGRDTTDGLHPNNTTGANKIGKYVSRKFMNWFVC